MSPEMLCMRAGIMRDSSGVVGLRFIQMVFNATFPLTLPYSQAWLHLEWLSEVPALCLPRCSLPVRACMGCGNPGVQHGFA